MLEQILHYFPPHVHPLTLVSDPDSLLADETILAHLSERGFSLLWETDPAQLRREVNEFGAWSRQRPLILITPRPLNQLPYDYWQQGHCVTLALHAFFPTLAYPVAQSLSPNQRWRLAQLPPQKLGRRGSLDFILRQLFGVDWAEIAAPAGLIGWLNRYHQAEPMPPLLAEQWLAQAQPHHPAWPLADWLANRERFEAFISQEWRQFVATQTENTVGEGRTPYHLAFADDERLQDTLPQLARSGALRPVTLADAAPLPVWAQVGVRASPADFAQQRADALFALLAEQSAALAAARWEQWQTTATAWAELTAWRHHPQRYLTAAQRTTYAQWQARLDADFADWLAQRYVPLAGQRLPQPHHLFHVPHWIAYERRRGTSGRVALLVMDGLSLAAWTVIAAVWRDRHPARRFVERLVLAQVPSLTAVSRQALISGERPANLADSLGHNRWEKRQWASFWTRENVPAAACAYEHLDLSGERPLPDALTSSRVQALCLIDNSLDEMVHGATQGLTSLHAALHAWLRGDAAAQLMAVTATLLARGYTVYLTSDHGHTEAWGMGQPAEGVTVQTRSKRARLYGDYHAAAAVQADLPQTTLWSSQQLLPEAVWALLAGADQDGRRLAFAPQGERVVTHGGATLDELVVPLIQIS